MRHQPSTQSGLGIYRYVLSKDAYSQLLFMMHWKSCLPSVNFLTKLGWEGRHGWAEGNTLQNTLKQQTASLGNFICFFAVKRKEEKKDNKK